MPTSNNPSHIAGAPLDPRVARPVEAFRDALVRMRDGEDLTVEDLDTAIDLLRMVETPTGAALAATVMPLFQDVFQANRDYSTRSEESGVPAASSNTTGSRSQMS
ncbi:hypothetical protein ABZX77_50785 [Streptomyces sp. NPDC004237]|uniref:hypothetical protein n=1 Tax=Streptomyces sp. NPDC004237 TaxID=3154455 RepID=UPI0033BA0392